MTKPHGTGLDGLLVDLIGQPFGLVPGPAPGVRIVSDEEKQAMAKATHSGVYEVDGHRYKVRKGDVLPEGATMESATEPVETPEPEAEIVEERARGAAPENRAKAEKPEKR